MIVHKARQPGLASGARALRQLLQIEQETIALPRLRPGTLFLQMSIRRANREMTK